MCRVAWLLSIAIVLGACGSDDGGARLITISGAHTDDDAGTLYLLGEGFAVGRECELTLTGTVYPPRRHPERLSVAVPCRALTSERASASLKEPVLAAHGTAWLEGRAELTFGGASGSGVSGSLDHVRVRLGLHAPTRVTEELALRHAALAFQRGIGVPGVEVGARGLVITALDDGGRAAAAGILVGDVVQRINGAPVEEAFDLVPTTDATVAKLEVLRRGTSGTLLLTVPLVPPSSTEDVVLWLVLALGCIAGVLLPRVPGVPIDRAQGRELGIAFIMGAALVIASGLATSRFDARLPWLVLLAAAGISLWIAYTRGRVSTFALLGDTASLASATSCVAALALVTGSLSDELWIASFDRALPWQWPLLAAPAGWLAAYGLVATCPRPHTSSVTHAWVRVLRLGTTAWLIAGLGFGGGHVPVSWDLGPTSMALTGASAFAAKAAAALLLLALVPRPRATTTSAHLASLAAPILALLAPVAASSAMGSALGALATGLVLGAVLHAARRALLGRTEPVRDPALAPFL